MLEISEPDVHIWFKGCLAIIQSSKIIKIKPL